MKKAFLFLGIILTATLQVRADEGMWLPSLISQRIGDMQAKGFRLSAEDVYSVNQASLRTPSCCLAAAALANSYPTKACS
jgi:hypothetical protein